VSSNQARRTNRSKPPTQHTKRISTGLREILFLSFCFASLYLLISIATFNPLDPSFWQSGANEEVSNKGGIVGAYFASSLLSLFGYFAYLFAGMVAYLGWLIYQGKHYDLLAQPRHMLLPGIGFILTLSAGCGLAIVHFAAQSHLLPSHAGGLLGLLVGKSLESILNQLGATLVLLAVFFTGITLLTGLSWLRLMDMLGYYTLHWLPAIGHFLLWRVWPTIRHYVGKMARMAARALTRLWAVLSALWHKRRHWLVWRPERGRSPEHGRNAVNEEYDNEPDAHADNTAPSQGVMSSATVKPSRFPSLGLGRFITKPPTPAPTPPVAPPTAPPAEASVLAHNVPAHNEVFTLPYTQAGVEGVRDTPAPHTEYVEPSFLSDMLTLPAFCHAEGALPLILGRDGRQPVVVDLARMPHLLLAGGHAEEVDQAMHGLLLCLLHKNDPQRLRLIVMDAKRKALARYSPLPHMLAPIITQPAKLLEALHGCVNEMERRYRLMAEAGVRNIDSYHRLIAENTANASNGDALPYVVLAVLELGNLMINAEQGREVEALMTRLAQKSRAAGIHLIIATSIPTANVLTALVKSNFPTRIALRVATVEESRVILGEPGAENLHGEGEMLYLTPGTGVPVRMQGIRARTEEVRASLDQLRQPWLGGQEDEGRLSKNDVLTKNE